MKHRDQTVTRAMLLENVWDVHFDANTMDRIGGLMTDLRQVTTDIAHDLRTPLTRLRQRLELATRPDAARVARAAPVSKLWD